MNDNLALAFVVVVVVMCLDQSRLSLRVTPKYLVSSTSPSTWPESAGCILNARQVARGECISPRAGAKLSNTRPVGYWSKCCNTSIITNLYIFACLYSVYCITHISTQLAYCANLMVVLSYITIMKLLHKTIAVETLYLICATYAVSKTIAFFTLNAKKL